MLDAIHLTGTVLVMLSWGTRATSGASALEHFPRSYHEAMRWYDGASRVPAEHVDTWWRTAVCLARRTAPVEAPVFDVLTQSATALFSRDDVPVEQLQHVPLAIVGGVLLTHSKLPASLGTDRITPRIDAAHGPGTAQLLFACAEHYPVIPWPNCHHNLRLLLPVIAGLTPADVEVIGGLLYRFDRAGWYDGTCLDQLRVGLRGLGATDGDLKLLERCHSPYPSMRDQAAAAFVVQRSASSLAGPCGGALIVAAGLLARTQEARTAGDLLVHTRLPFPEVFSSAKALHAD